MNQLGCERRAGRAFVDLAAGAPALGCIDSYEEQPRKGLQFDDGLQPTAIQVLVLGGQQSCALRNLVAPRGTVSQLATDHNRNLYETVTSSS